MLYRTKTVEAARADGEKIRLIGEAEAKAVEAVGRLVNKVINLSITTPYFRAEAESMRMKASAYKQYGDAAIMSLVLEALPQVTINNSLPFMTLFLLNIEFYFRLLLKLLLHSQRLMK